MNNLHISLTEFRNESRVLKQTSTISTLPGIEHVYIAALLADDLNKEEDIGDKVSLKRFALKTRGLNKGLLAQLLKYIEFVFRVLFFYKNKDVGMVNIHALGLLPLGCLLKLVYGCKLIYDTHELETETNGLRGLRKKIGKWVERLLIKKSDHVFVVSENIADWYRDTYKIPAVTVVLNASHAQQIEKNDYFRKIFCLRKDQVIVLYQGGLASGRGIDLLMEAFKQRTDDKVIIIFMGYGNLEKECQLASKFYDTIFFHKAVPPSVLLSYTVSADVGISFIENTCLSYYFCMPNKLFEYAIAGLPVIVSNMKEMREMVEHYQMGVVVKGNKAGEINKAIDELIKLDLTELKRNARKAAKDNSWEVQEVKMLNVYRAMSAGIRE
jgi:glycosyltransferase involved in cell wall biosynthesis